MDQLNHDYYLARAGSSRKLAQRAASPEIAAIHQKLASLYEHNAARVRQGMPQSGGNAQAA